MLYGVLLFTISLALSQTHAAPWQPKLRGCANRLYSHVGVVGVLTGATTFSQYIQCTYQTQYQNPPVTSYCWYDYQNYTLYNSPNTPQPGVDSNPACPPILPDAAEYRIRSSLSLGKCVTALGDYDGAPVQIQDCRTGTDNIYGWPKQVWTFNGSLIQPAFSNKCLDVTEGSQNDGVKLQIWTCVDGNANQQFSHWDQNVVIVPTDHINWMLNRFKCMDLTDGKLDNGNPIQLWGCNYQNPNQEWSLEPQA